MGIRRKIKTIVIILIVIGIALVSFTTLASYYSNPETYSETIQSLDNKRNDVLAMSAASASVSTALTLIPGDVAEPVANQLANLSSTLMIVLCAIFLEKYILTLAGMLTFRLLIPIACILFLMFICLHKEAFKIMSFKIALLGICIVILVPASTWATNFIENTYSVSIQQNVEKANNAANTLNKKSNTDENFFTKLIKDTKQGASNLYNKIKEVLENLIEATAILIITSCIIPLLTLLLFIWIINLILGLNISIPIGKLKKFARSGSKLRHKAIISRNSNDTDSNSF